MTYCGGDRKNVMDSLQKQLPRGSKAITNFTSIALLSPMFKALCNHHNSIITLLKMWLVP